jgi:hypothetical protein
MNLKSNLKILALTAIISTAVIFVFGSIFFKELFNYGDWILVIFPSQIILSFMVMSPLLLFFWILEKINNVKQTSVIKLVGLRTTIGALYISALLWFSIFSDSKQRLKNPFNYYEDLKYLGICTVLTMLTFIAIDYFYTTKEVKNRS